MENSFYDDEQVTEKKLSDSIYNRIKAMPNARIIFSDEAKIQPRTIQTFQQKLDFKPKGLWYAIGTEWIDWIRMEMPEWEKKHAHLLSLVPDRILKIKNYKELAAFENQFGKNLIPNSLTKYIDWPAAAKKYTGIEIAPYIYEARLKHLWYYGWDVASGCVWMASAIQSIELIK